MSRPAGKVVSKFCFNETKSTLNDRHSSEIVSNCFSDLALSAAQVTKHVTDLRRIRATLTAISFIEGFEGLTFEFLRAVSRLCSVER
jgi:hypothetical protein